LRENSFQNKAIEYLESVGAYVIDFWGSPYSRKGIPDLICCFRGHYIAFELKKPNETKKGLPAQLFHLNKIVRAGGAAHIVNSIEEIRYVLAYFN
jgi:penicillin-binding protein-related factor A (putative recombinase)